MNKKFKSIPSVGDVVVHYRWCFENTKGEFPKYETVTEVERLMGLDQRLFPKNCSCHEDALMNSDGSPIKIYLICKRPKSAFSQCINNFRPATTQEEFLYYLYGPHILE